MRFAVVFLSVIATVVAQLTVNTPVGAITCLNQQVTWTGGTAPYTLQVQPGGDVTAAALETFTGLTGNSYSWFVIEGANTQVFLRLRDNSGTTVESGTFTIRAGGTCPTSGTSGSTTAAGGATTTPATPGTTTPVTPGTTSTTPAGTTTGASSGSSPAVSGTTTSRASTTTPNGASSLKVAGGLVGVVAGVVAMLA